MPGVRVRFAPGVLYCCYRYSFHTLPQIAMMHRRPNYRLAEFRSHSPSKKSAPYLMCKMPPLCMNSEA
ncbi:hypothetical protein ACLOJK_005620 [Asimina triloba]